MLENLIFKEETGSTNDDLKALAQKGAPAFTLVQAARQTQGRGRRGRVWEGKTGNLYCSLLLRPKVSLSEAALLTYLAAVALLQAVRKLRPEGKFACKWPNDILYNGGKLAGILLEAEGFSPQIDWLVVGVGVNLAWAPEIALYPTASLGADISPEQMLEALMGEFIPLYTLWEQEGFAPIRELWLASAHKLGEEVKIDLGGEVKSGIFNGLGQNGALILGNQQIMAGDVIL